MINYATVDDVTGLITSVGVALAIENGLAQYGETVRECGASVGALSHWWNGTEFIEYGAAAKITYANRPQGNFSWSPSTGTWIDNRTLAEAKADAWTTIKARREVAFAARAVSSASLAYSITKDKDNLGDRIKSLEAAIAIGAATSATEANWRDLDNNAYPLTIAGYYLLAAEMGARGQAIYEKSWALDALVTAAADKAAISAIDTEADWP